MFSIRVLECEGGDFTRDTSLVLMHSAPSQPNPTYPYCACLGTRKPGKLQNIRHYYWYELDFSSSRAVCVGARPWKYDHHTYICRKAELLCFFLKAMGAGVITGIWDILTLFLVWQRICKASGIADVYRQRWPHNIRWTDGLLAIQRHKNKDTRYHNMYQWLSGWLLHCVSRVWFPHSLITANIYYIWRHLNVSNNKVMQVLCNICIM